MTSRRDSQHESRPRLNLVVGTTVLSVVLAAVLALSFFLTMRSELWDLSPWVFYRGPGSVLFVCFLVRLYRWCGWKHLLLALVPVLAIALVAIARLFGTSFRDPALYVALGVLLAMVVGPGLLGMGVAAWATSRVRTTRGRAIVLLLFVCLLLGIPGGRWLGWRVVAWYTGSHADIAGAPYLQAKAEDLEHTTVAATLDAAIRADTNVVWCATFQIAWNELWSLAGEDIRMEREDPVVALLNRKAVTRKNLDDKTYFATAGLVGNGVLKTIADGLERQFKGAASPQLVPSRADLPPDAVVAYGYLFANLPFKWAFDRLEYPICFSDARTQVKAFGIDQYLERQEKERRAASQLLIHVLDKEHGAIIELATRMPNHRLILAKVPPLATLGATAQSVMAQVQQSKPRTMPEWESLGIPILDFDLTREYAELTGRPLQAGKPPLAGVSFVQATQQIRFRLDERGAMLKSEARITTLGDSAGANLIFNEPFLILLQLAGSDQPYFAAWIAHPELLVKF